jgi:acetyl esterase/lipase
MDPKGKILLEGEHYIKSISNSFMNNDDNHDNSQNNFDLILSKVETNHLDYYVKIRLLNNRKFYIPKFKDFWNIFDCCAVQKNYTRNALIIHIHGGGFIAMSASSHENYTRKWVNSLEVPLISIDYRLAPAHPYPYALDDVYQAYMWIINYAEDILKIKLDKIILVGDSAGGNLCLSLCYFLIYHNKRLPTALFLAYPGKLITNSFSDESINDYF